MGRVLKVLNINRCISCYSCMLACARTVYKSFSLRKSAVQIRSRGGLQSRLQADICRGCEDAPCAAACPTGALLPRKGGGVVYLPAKCNGCRECVKACIVRVIAFDEEEARPIVCIQCGTCARFCPHEVLAMVEG
ncbi:MAG TPA: (Fe-S)-binding protein [Peptococcaceae bacterium]|nr:(Fe-S)-binding protein [Peptococcaceae bacterium]